MTFILLFIGNGLQGSAQGFFVIVQIGNRSKPALKVLLPLVVPFSYGIGFEHRATRPHNGTVFTTRRRSVGPPALSERIKNQLSIVRVGIR